MEAKNIDKFRNSKPGNAGFVVKIINMTIETKLSIGDVITLAGNDFFVDSISFDGLVGYWVINAKEPEKRFWLKESLIPIVEIKG